ncbi:MAG: type pilus assembly protein PilC [Abditibacteriota bacterium]|nr:type pilus assembly protein PilC [Abditibacteriota bacterium]
MPNFAFQARDRGGRQISGTREAADQRAALEGLREAGLFVTQLAPARGRRTQSAPQDLASAPARLESTSVAPVEALADRSHAANATGTSIATSAEVTAAPLPGFPGTAERATTAASATTVAGTASTSTTTKAKPQGDVWARANAKQMSLFFRQMHSMLHAGTSLAQALSILAQHDASPALRRASYEMHLRTSRGEPWHDTLRAYPGLFSELMIGMIQAGEMGGFLDRMCLRLSEYCERDYEIQQTIKRETWYPKLLVFCSIFIPSVVPLVLTGIGVMPGNPIVNWFKSVYGPLSLVLGVWGAWKVANYFAPLLGHKKTLRVTVDRLKLMVPIGGKAVRGLATAKFSRALGATYAAGMAPHMSIRIAANACGNEAIAQSAMAIIPRIERGEPMTDALASTGHFQAVILQMLRTGEETGKIDEQLDKVADFLEADAETTIKQAVKVLGIVAFLLVALNIGAFVIDFYTGVFSNMVDGAS